MFYVLESICTLILLFYWELISDPLSLWLRLSLHPQGGFDWWWRCGVVYVLVCVYSKNSTFKLFCAPPCAGGDKLGLSGKADPYLAAGKDPLIGKM